MIELSVSDRFGASASTLALYLTNLGLLQVFGAKRSKKKFAFAFVDAQCKQTLSLSFGNVEILDCFYQIIG